MLHHFPCCPPRPPASLPLLPQAKHVEVEGRLREVEVANVALVAAAAAVSAEDLLQERSARERFEAESTGLAAQLAEATERAGKEKVETDRKLDSAKDYIGRMQLERAEVDKKFHAMKDDLLTRLQNACSQRDEARAQVLGEGGEGAWQDRGDVWCGCVQASLG